MARCPFAIWHPTMHRGQPYTRGPFRIVHHTTESSSTTGSLHELLNKGYESHFLVDDKNIWQLIDTSVSSRALRHNGWPETNRLSAVQIEMVGFAGQPKNRTTLANMRKLCRWIEETHGVPRVWPNGYPNPPINGKDPGHHNRNSQNWATMGGHYCHSQVPENTHWDAAYTKEEVEFLMADEVPASNPTGGAAVS